MNLLWASLVGGEAAQDYVDGGFTLAAAQIGQFMKPNEISETSISYGGLSSVESAPCPGAVVRVVADHDGIVPGCPSKGATVNDVVLDVAYNGTSTGTLPAEVWPP